MKKLIACLIIFLSMHSLQASGPLQKESSEISLEARKRYQARYYKKYKNRNVKLSKLEVKIKEAQRKYHERKKR